VAQVRRRRRWAKDGSGFYYSRFPEPAAGQTFQESSLNQKVYFHKLGTAQAADRLVYATPANPDYGHPRDGQRGRPLAGHHHLGRDRRPLRSHADRPARRKGAKPRTLITGFDNNYSMSATSGQTFYFVTNDGAPKLKLVAIDVASQGGGARDADRRGRRRSTACR
jgi:prolyl oligopeptidase